MKDKLENGMYIRSKIGQIGKINNFSEYNVCVELNEMFLDIVRIENIQKASFNIIDLIEVGDYVNGYKVSAIYNPNGDEIVNITLIMEYGYETINTYIDDYSINSIVTKEQFERMSYYIQDVSNSKNKRR